MSKRTFLNKIAALELLAESFPDAISIYGARRKPLKVGIHRDILKALNGGLNAEEIGAALGFYTASESYLEKMLSGAWRYDLAGRHIGEVTVDEARYATERWKAIHDRRGRR